LSTRGPDDEQIVRRAWLTLPPAHRRLLEQIGASQHRVVHEPLGTSADGMLRSAGHRGLARSARDRLNRALGVWVQELRVVLINESHPALAGLNQQSREAFMAHIAWHEWGHALSRARCSDEDVASGRALLDLAPHGIAQPIRSAGYRAFDYTHEVIAETYALLMARRLLGYRGRPQWLHNEIYSLLTRVTGWTE
jgi:hypothetical protein